LAGNNEQNCDVCALLEQAIALLEPEGNNTLKLLPCGSDPQPAPEEGEPVPPDPEGTKSLAWNGTGIEALLEAAKVTQQGIAEIWEKVKCEADEPIVIYPNDVYSEFALEGRLTLEFTTLDAYPKQVVGNSRWSLDIPNPREEYNWATDFEAFRLIKGSWYGRCIWSESGIRSGAYCADQEEAQKLIDYIAGLTTATPLRQRITSSGRTGLSTAELRIIRVVKATIENGQVIETVCYKPPTT
jgi:hypothetical protein